MIGQGIGELLPYALGVAISPIPIIAIILMLISARAGANSLAFLAGWVVGVTGACIVLLALSGLLDTTSSGAPSDQSSWIKIILGVALLGMARRNFAKRPKDGQEAELPKWLSTIDSFTPAKSAGLGVLLSAVNPKNLLLIAGGMVALSQYKASVGDEAVVLIVFVLIVISTVAGPVLLYRLGGEKAKHTLDGMKVWLQNENAVVMAVLLLVIGVVLLGKGISGLSA